MGSALQVEDEMSCWSKFEFPKSMLMAPITIQANDTRIAAMPTAEIPPHFFWSSSMMIITKDKKNNQN